MVRRSRRWRVGGATFAVLIAALALGPTTALPAPAALAAPVTVRVMEFNIEYGGTLISFESVVEAIQAADADVVALEESWGNVPRVAAELGYHYNVRLQIVSRYPLIDPPGGRGRYLFVELAPGQVAAIGNVHLPAGPYSPNLIRRGAKRAEILEIERRVRLPAVRPSVEALAALVDRGIPSFLLGDFNAPSHHDWTPATVGQRPHVLYPVRWPVSLYVEGAGFHDSYREAHPDPVTDEGLTWPGGRPKIDGWNPGPNAPADRIDFVYAAGTVQTLGSELVGEGGGPGVDIAIDPWPTDHRGVVSTFSVQAGTPPTFVAPASRVVEAGDQVTAVFHAPAAAGASIVVTRPRDDEPLDRGPDGRRRRRQDRGADAGPRAGCVRALAPDGHRGALGVSVLGGGAGRRSGRDGRAERVRVGEPIRVRWANAPGQRWDWIGVYERGADPNVAYYLTWFYTEASIQGNGLLNEASEGPWPLDPGRYSVYLLSDDGYEILAGAPFRIRG